MRTFLTTVLLMVMTFVCKAQIQAVVTFEEDTTAVKYHVFKWEGEQADNPLVEDSSFSFIQSIADTHFTTTETQFEFDTEQNGNYIQLAGFNENEFGIMAGATLSNLVLKPSEANKMNILLLEIGMSEAPDTNFIGMYFDEAMDQLGLYDKSKYEIVGNSGDTVEIYQILNVPETDSMVVIVTGKLSDDSTEYVVKVYDVRDVAGNLISQQNNFAIVNLENR